MPAFTSTTVTTLFRKVVSVARYVQPGMKGVVSARTVSPRRTINTLQSTRNAVKQIIHQTFPSVSTPSHLLQDVGTATRQLSTFRALSSSTSAAHSNPRMVRGAVRKAIRSTSTRPTFISGPSIQANVGLGSARTFASGPTTGLQAKVPMTMRAFASLLEDDHKHTAAHLPRPTRYSPYTRKSSRRIRRSTRTCEWSINASNTQKSYRHYFTLPYSHATENASLPPTPDTLITPGITTVLALPLSPSLEALLEPTPRVPYVDTTLGLGTLARLTHGLMPIHDALSIYASTRIIPLMCRLENLGLVDHHPDSNQQIEAFVEFDSQGQPDILRLVFRDRSAKDVNALLGDGLRKGEERDAWVLCENQDSSMELSITEQKSIMEDWTATPSQSRLRVDREAEVDDEQLVFPTLDMSDVVLSSNEGFSPTKDSGTPTSWPSSGSITPFSPSVDMLTPSSHSDSYSSQTVHSLSTSLLSRLSELDRVENEILWEISPSDEDSDVESAFADGESESWGEVSQVSSIGFAEQDASEPSSPSVLGRWSGSGQGFGFTQPW